MLRRSKPLARSAFRRREGPNVQATEHPRAPIRPLANPPNYSGSASGIPIEKENAVECEEYRRIVASFCCARCFVFGYSQAAHPPPTGKSRKEDDRAIFPLCCDRPGQVGCHFLFDQYKLMPHDEAVEQAKEWGRETRAKVINQGRWPSRLPMWTENATQGATA
jgi:hypothetical protein